METDIFIQDDPRMWNNNFTQQWFKRYRSNCIIYCRSVPYNIVTLYLITKFYKLVLRQSYYSHIGAKFQE